MCKNIWHKENSEKRPNKNFPLQKHFSSTKNFKGQKQQLWNGVWTSNHTKVKIIYYSLWWSTFFPIFTRFAYQNDFLNLGVAILLLVAVALYHSCSKRIFVRTMCFGKVKRSQTKAFLEKGSPPLFRQVMVLWSEHHALSIVLSFETLFWCS